LNGSHSIGYPRLTRLHTEGGLWKQCAPRSQPEPDHLQDYACSIKAVESPPANNSLERTQPQRDFMYDVAVLRGSARGR